MLASGKLSSGRKTVRAALCFVCLVALAGCRRQKGPDANYEKAARIYQQLYASQLDDAYGDPQMDQVVVLLKTVDSASSDAEAARAMLHAIDHGRQELARSRAAREKMGAAAAASARTAISNIDPTKVLAASEPDAGPAQDPYGPGAPVAEINTASGGCLAEFEPFQEQRTGVSGSVYRMTKSPGCMDKLPGYVGQAVLVVDGRVYRRIPDFEPTPIAPPPQLLVPDAGAPARAPAPAPAPDAGE